MPAVLRVCISCRVLNRPVWYQVSVPTPASMRPCPFSISPVYSVYTRPLMLILGFRLPVDFGPYWEVARSAPL